MLVDWWSSDLLRGPCAQWGNGCYWAQNIIDALGYATLPIVIGNLTPFDLESSNDLRPGSDYLQNINSVYPNTIPGDANTYLLASAEYWQHHLRLLESALEGGIEDGDYVKIANYLSYVYLIFNIYNNYTAWYYYFDYIYNYNWWSLWRAYRHWRLANEWYVGFTSLSYLQQLEWSTYIDGSREFWGNWWTSDAIVPSYSQLGLNIPNNNSTRIVITGANHNEEQEFPDIINFIDNTLRNDFGIN